MGRPPKVSVDREREILRLHERDGWSFKRIARKFELTDRGVAKIVDRAVERGDSGWWKTGDAELDAVIQEAAGACLAEPKAAQLQLDAFAKWVREGREAGYLDVLFQLGRQG